MHRRPPEPRTLLLAAFHSAVSAVRAEALLPRHLPAPPKGRLLVVGAGKAAADMAACLERHWPPEAAVAGLVITRHGHGVPTRRIRVVEAGHPLPDQAGQHAARDMLALLRTAGPDDQVLALLSGGASSLLTLPAEGLSLGDISTTSHALLNSGAPIADINCVRKHLSLTLGGRLAAQCAAPMRVLILSDVSNDDPSVIASGPFSPDPGTFADALAVLARWRITPPAAILDHLTRGQAGQVPDTPKPGNSCFDRVETRIIGNGLTALHAAAAALHALGAQTEITHAAYAGDADALAHQLAEIARARQRQRLPGSAPLILLSGGETQVEVKGGGRGGRNTAFLLQLARELQGLPAVYALAADTDGIDGTGDHAGACLAPDSLTRARERAINVDACLNNSDSYRFFALLGDLVITGPTRTNANDFRAVAIYSGT